MYYNTVQYTHSTQTYIYKKNVKSDLLLMLLFFSLVFFFSSFKIIINSSECLSKCLWVTMCVPTCVYVCVRKEMRVFYIITSYIQNLKQIT